MWPIGRCDGSPDCPTSEDEANCEAYFNSMHSTFIPDNNTLVSYLNYSASQLDEFDKESKTDNTTNINKGNGEKRQIQLNHNENSSNNKVTHLINNNNNNNNNIRSSIRASSATSASNKQKQQNQISSYLSNHSQILNNNNNNNKTR